MAVNPFPEGYNRVIPYLVLEDAASAIEFMKKVLDADDYVRMDGPDGSIMHAELRIGDSVVMVGGAGGENLPQPAMLHVYVEDCDATYNRALEAGATSLREPENQFYGDRSAMVKDTWGNSWSFATHVEDVSPEEMERRMAEQGAQQ